MKLDKDLPVRITKERDIIIPIHPGNPIARSLLIERVKEVIRELMLEKELDRLRRESLGWETDVVE